MTVECQPKSGAARYRVNPRNRREVQRQPQAGARWEEYVLADVQDEAYDTAYDAGHMDGEWAAWGAMRDHAVRVRKDIEREAGLR
jgi:hypothetical protein